MKKTFLNQIYSNTALVLSANNQAGFTSISIAELFKGLLFSNLCVSVVYTHNNATSKGLLSYIENQNNGAKIAPYNVQISHTSNVPLTITSQYFAEFIFPTNYPFNNIVIELFNCEDATITANVNAYVY